MTDLAWLNDESLARWVCRLPIPVLTGIGHERDSTILDEVAHRKFDTPSKVANHISQTVRDHALTALADLERIGVQTRRIVTRYAELMAAHRERVVARVVLSLERAESGMERLGCEVRVGSGHKLETAENLLCVSRERLVTGADRAIERAAVRLATSKEAVGQLSVRQVEREDAAIEKMVQAVALNASKSIAIAEFGAGEMRDRVVSAGHHSAVLAGSKLDDAVGRVMRGAQALRKDAGNRIDSFVQRIVCVGPEATLKRGYAIARDRDGRPLTTKKQAAALPVFQVEFQDGRLGVEVSEK